MLVASGHDDPFTGRLRCHDLAYHGEPPRNHAYAEIYEPIPAEVKARIVSQASTRFPTYTDFSDMPALLKKFGTYFVELRYYYDNHGKESSYSPFELTALLEALQDEVSAFLEPHRR